MSGKGNPDLIAKNGPGRGRTKGAKGRLTRERVEKELRIVALMNARQLFGTGKKRNTLLDVADMPEDMQRCIASVKVRTENLTAGDKKQDETVEIRLWPKVQALELCARSLGMLKDKVEISAPEELLSKLDRAKVRARGEE